MREQNGARSYLLIAVSVIIAGMLGWFVLSYNALVAKEEQVRTAWSQVESNLQRKVDLLPNLVKVVKKYALHEKELLSHISALRANAQKLYLLSRGKTDAGDIEAVQRMQKMVDGSIMKLFAVAENYPDLKSSEHFMQLQSQIEGAENRINITRMRFNEAAGEYNRYMRTVPANIVAAVAGFKRKAYFRAEKNAHKKYDIGM